MKILICLLWIDIMTQVPSFEELQIVEEYPGSERKAYRSSSNGSITIQKDSLKNSTETMTELKNSSRIEQKLLIHQRDQFSIGKTKKELNGSTISQERTISKSQRLTEEEEISKVLLEGPASQNYELFIDQSLYLDKLNNGPKVWKETRKMNRKSLTKIPLEKLVEAMNIMEDIDIVPIDHVVTIWNMVKNTRAYTDLNVADLQKMGTFVQWVPDNDLFYLNMKNWDLVEVLGKIRQFGKHDFGILSASLLRTHGFGILRNHKAINRMFGILCGFDVDLLRTIPIREFRLINGEIFNYISSCSKAQIRFLLELAMKPTIFGPPQVWKEETLKKADMLLLALKPQELISIRPPAMKGIPVQIIQMMKIELIMAFSGTQLPYLSPEAYLAYKKRIFLSSRQIYHKPNVSCSLLVLVAFLLYLEQTS